jgi:hypothetical protein
MEEFRMQPGTNPDDLHTILSRFSTWAEKQPVSSNGNHHKNGIGAEEVREIPYEEAIRQYRKRRAPQERQRVQAPTVAADPAKEVGPEVKIEAYPPTVVPREPPVEAAPLCTSETVTIAATAPPQKGLAGIVPPELAPAHPPLATKDQVARIAKPKTPSKRKAADAAQKSTPPEVANQVSPNTEEDVATTAAEHAVTSVVQVRPLTKNHLASSPAKLTVQAPSQVKERVTSGRANPAIRARPQMKKHPASSRATPAIQAGSQTKRHTASVAAPAKHAATPASKPRGKRHPAFRHVLANSVQAKPLRTPKTRAPKKQAAPDRNRRITTRFSTAEQRRIEKQAAEAGLTVSAWLRNCALAQPGTRIDPVGRRAAKAENKGASTTPSNYPPETLFSPPRNSLLGNWLTLLRHRFLASPQRFAEQA